MLAGCFSCLPRVNWKNLYASPASTHNEGSRKCLRSCLLSAYMLEAPTYTVPQICRESRCAHKHSAMTSVLGGLHLFQIVRFSDKAKYSKFYEQYRNQRFCVPFLPHQTTWRPCSQYFLNLYLCESQITLLSPILYCLSDKPEVPYEACIFTTHGEGRQQAGVTWAFGKRTLVTL